MLREDYNSIVNLKRGKLLSSQPSLSRSILILTTESEFATDPQSDTFDVNPVTVAPDLSVQCKLSAEFICERLIVG